MFAFVEKYIIFLNLSPLAPAVNIYIRNTLGRIIFVPVDIIRFITAIYKDTHSTGIGTGLTWLKVAGMG